ncbi:MBL fold metallo-hydrolase [Prosthecochloris sp.]|uniref:MBL fold metallo-hydrolase n=1 Tax=Prosthecochloris sp. TaxID=290513 RepID=UPI00257B3A39|nr:MBL fold metallo-hydrolase [Prosthecochloris sp.]
MNRGIDMIEFIPYASSSEANMYEVTDGNTRILIECGLTWQEMQKLTGYSTTGFDACLLTHEHKDHSKGADDLYLHGIDIYCSEGTRKGIGLLAGIKILNLTGDWRRLRIGDFLIKPFETRHDAAEPLGFLILHKPSGDTLLFATDTFYLPYTFQGLTHIAIECNYSPDLLAPDCPYKDRLFSSHMSLQTCIQALKANDLSRTREIHLIHLSEGNSDEERFKREVQEAVGIPTYVAPKRREL